MFTLYGIPNCETVKKTRRWLDAQQVPYLFYDYKKQGISREKLDDWLSQVPWEKLLNRAGTTWRKLSDEQKNGITDAASAAEFMQSNTSAIKRPLLENEAGKVLALGFSEKEYGQILA
ncbi:ArsC family reductase [Salmonirosea aquatica]|uniref:ArsC family reductase n=1 Tax=Salmonirosea aquatica TaxID=2654236 RepID=A0A7C9BIU6_9BACT|nr:ArsC family reductase [Cytophagaceae bacterium SJW1-29]